MKLLLALISIIIDLLLLNIYRVTSLNLNYFYPMFTISSLVYICNLYTNANRKNYYYFVFLIAVIYDTIVTNNLLITVLLFELIALINVKIKKNFSNNLFNNILRTIISISIYDMLFHLLLVLVRFQDFNIIRVLYKVTHSIIINVAYVIIMFFVLKNKKTT